LTPKIAELNHNLALLNDIKNCIENARMKELGLSDFGDAIPDIDEVRARLNIETVKAKIAEYKGKVNGDPIDYYADKGIFYKGKQEDDAGKNDMEHVKNILGIIASGGKSGGI